MGKNKKNMLFIYNPHAGKGKVKQNLCDILEIFSKNDFLVTAFPTQGAEDATNIIREYSEQFDMIACSGGDGTINEITAGLMSLPPESRRPCGYIPAGTTNDFATTLNIPKDMLKAAELIVYGSNFMYDIGSLNNKYFTYLAGFGAFTEVSYETPQATKNIFGRTAYFLNGITHLGKISPIKMKIETDTVTIEDEFLIGFIANTYSVAGIVNLKEEDVILDDGKFEAVFVKNPSSPIQLQETINDILRQNHNSSHYYILRSSKIVCTSEAPTAWTIDGEFGGELETAEIINHARAVTFITNKFSDQN